MSTELWADVEFIRDGTARWLWVVRSPKALRGAGVAMSRTDADKAAMEAIEGVSQREKAGRQVVENERWATTSLNLDELERLDREEREGRRTDGEDGHTEESDPANLGGL